jgi:hypothetical protein
METKNNLTLTAQPRSCASLHETNKNFNLKKYETEDNRSFLLSVFDSLENLFVKLSRLEYLITKKKLENILYNKKKEDLNENQN